MGNLGATEILLILLVVLLLFGAKRIPEIARGLGKGIREFKDATHDIKREITMSDAPPPTHQIPQAQVPYTPPQAHTAPPVAPPAAPPTPPAGEAPQG